MDECKQFEHEWEQVYYGMKCKVCGLFYPDTGNWFAPPADDEEEDYHSYDCTCENCLQNHPERDILYGDGDYFDWGEDDEYTKKCGACGEMNKEGSSFCWSCEAEI